jgi:hypothetical protein
VHTISRSMCLGLFLGSIASHGWAANEASDVTPGIALPPVTASTNQEGVTVHRFSMTAVVTNTATATNELAVLRQKLVKIDDEIKQVLTRQTPLKPVMNQDYRTMIAFSTNYVPKDEEGMKIKARVTELETELKDLRGKLQTKMMDDPVYKEAKRKVDANRQEWVDIAKRKEELRLERTEVGAKIWQLQQLIEAAGKTDKTVDKEAATEKPAR